MKAKGLIFDYGGTIDTNSVHWSEVLWDGYVAAGIDVDRQAFRDAYVHGERTLARQPLVRPGHTMLDVLRIKVGIELQWLAESGQWKMDNGKWTMGNGKWKMDKEKEIKAKGEAVADHCYAYVLKVLETSRAVLQHLSERYPMVLVSNFYGNIRSVLRDFRLDLFQDIVESAVVGIRKPDPRIFRLGVEALGMAAQDVVVIGDSYSKDIVPAASIGCQTVWIRGRGWADDEAVDEGLPTAIISTIQELTYIL